MTAKARKLMPTAKEADALARALAQRDELREQVGRLRGERNRKTASSENPQAPGDHPAPAAARPDATQTVTALDQQIDRLTRERDEMRTALANRERDNLSLASDLDGFEKWAKAAMTDRDKAIADMYAAREAGAAALEDGKQQIAALVAEASALRDNLGREKEARVIAERKSTTAESMVDEIRKILADRY